MLRKNKFFMIRVSDSLKSEYIKFCEKNGYTISKRIISLIVKDLNNEL